MATRKIKPVHPGEHLAEYLEELDITQYRLARDIHVSPRRINEIVKGKRAVSADTALRLGRYFKTSPEYWLNLQSQYELEAKSAEIGRKIEQEIEPYAA